MLSPQQKFSLGYFLLTLLGLLLIQSVFFAPQSETLSYRDFKTLLKAGKVVDLLVGERTITGRLTTDGLAGLLPPEKMEALQKLGQGEHCFRTVKLDDPSLIPDLEAAGVQFQGQIENHWLGTLLSWVVPTLVFLAIWGFLMRRMGPASGLMTIGKSKAEEHSVDQPSLAFWSLSAPEMLQQLQATPAELTGAEATQRLARYGANLLKPHKRSDVVTLLLAQFKSPIILILVFATGLSFFLRDPVDACIILTIVLVSGLLGLWQERSATNAVEQLLAIVQIHAAVLRDGGPTDIPVAALVPGDIVILNAGALVPGDCLVQASTDLFVDEAMLTGETFPVEKAVAVLSAETPLGQRTNPLWMGTHVVSGSATALVIRTGKDTEFGKVSERLRLRPQETAFEHGIRQFGYFLMEVTLVLVVAIFAINVSLVRPVLNAFLFSLALAVGLTPQLLPAIISINLAHGAKRMAHAQVIVKRLAAIENFGSMNVICSDKTGTLTEGSAHVHSALDVAVAPSENVLLYAYLNAFYETGFPNPIDAAIRTHRQFDLAGYRKVDEIPYDFLRKRLSILVAHDETHLSESHTCIWAEERLLMERSPAYFAYPARTKRVIPFVA